MIYLFRKYELLYKTDELFEEEMTAPEIFDAKGWKTDPSKFWETLVRTRTLEAHGPNICIDITVYSVFNIYIDSVTITFRFED